MTAENIKTEVRSYLIDELYFNPRQTDDGTDLFATGNLDSLAFVNLVTFLEERYSIKVAVDDLQPERFGSLDRIAALVLELKR